MHGFLKQLRSLPESPMRLLASWFFCCALFEILRPWYLLYSAGFVLIMLLVFVLLTLIQQHWQSKPLTTAFLAFGTVFYAFVLIASRGSSTASGLALIALVLGALLLVLVPLLRNQWLPACPGGISAKRSLGLCALIGVLFAAVLGTITCLRYLTFSSPNYDFGIFCNMFYHMKETGLPLVSCERDQLLSHFAVHISPIYYLLLPFYAVFPSPLTLQIAQTVILASGIIPLYRLSEHFRLSHGNTVLLIFLYAVYPAVSTGCFYDLHENCFLVPLLLWLFDCYERKHTGYLVLVACLLLAVKEDAAVYLVFFCLYIAFSRRDWRQALPLATAAIAWFLLAVFLLQQFGTGAMFGRYGALLNSDKETGGLLGTLLRDPAYFLEQIVSASNLSKKLLWLFELLLPFGVLLWTPRGKYSRLLLLCPLLLNLLTQYVYQFNINYQYSFGTLPFLFYLFVQNAADRSLFIARKHLLFSVTAAGLLYTALVLPQLAHYTTSFVEKHNTYEQMQTLLDTVPDDASVIASTMLVPHLANRDEIYEDVYHATPDTDFVVLDLRGNFRTQSTSYQEKCLNCGYTVVVDDDLLVVLQSPAYKKDALT